MSFLKFKAIFFCLFSMALFAAKAQHPDYVQQFLPKVLPKSPEQAAFAKYGTYEVNMYSGVPSISIPLYEVKVGDLTVPVTLTYHASGNKVSETPSWVGLGWNLSAGGSINRKVMGRPDELQGCYFSGGSPVLLPGQIDVFAQSGIDYLKSIVQGIYDVEPDIYSYSLPGKSGKFVYSQSNLSSPVVFPYDPVKIQRTQTGPSTQTFALQDESGRQFLFDAHEWSSSGTVNDAAASWLLTRMVGANRQDTIQFVYVPRSGAGSTDFSQSEVLSISDDSKNYFGYTVFNNDNGTTSVSTNYSTVEWKTLSEILFRNGKIVFEQATDARLDLIAGKDAPKRLMAMKIFQLYPGTKAYQHIKTIRFYHSYFLNSTDNSRRLRLDSVYIADGNEVIGEKYRFTYNTSVSLPSYTSKSVDYWGYYNGRNNTTLIPGMTIGYMDINGNSTRQIGGAVDGRDPDSAFMKAYILRSITFPTGGRTEFDFETNRYIDDAGTARLAGGLRIKAIRSFDGVSATPVVRIYEYGVGGSGIGRRNFTLSNYFFQTEQFLKHWGPQVPGGADVFVVAEKRVRTFYSSPTNELEPYDGVPVAYPVVTEYNGLTGTSLGKTVYTFRDRADVLNLVTGLGRPIINSYHFDRGQLALKEVYRTDGAAFTKISSTYNEYEAFPQQWSSNIGLVVLKKIVNSASSGGSNNFCAPSTQNNLGCNDSYSYAFANYSIRAGDSRLVKTVDTVFDELNSARYTVNTVEYKYDNFTHQQLTRQVTQNSLGDVVTIYRKYQEESLGVFPNSQMKAAGIADKVTEERQTIKKFGQATESDLSVTTTSYNSWGGGNFLPNQILTKKGSLGSEARIEFGAYDNRGNLLEVKKTSDLSISYIWDYEDMYVVAEAKNATSSQIAYTSFEATGKGRWTYSGLPVYDGTAPSGKKVYQLTTGVISRTGLPGGTYIVSYWSKSGIQTVSGSSSTTTGRTVDGWTLYLHRVVNPAGGNISLSGTGTVDELRLAPESAQMVTRTYDPLTGVTSEADVSCRILYYDYDDLGRLLVIRDQDKRIVKRYCYNIQGEPERCDLFYNTVKTGSFTRNNCLQGFTPGTTTYTVQANVYSGSSLPIAEAKAQSDVNANGQAYANLVCACTPIAQAVQGYNAKSFNYRLRLTNTETSVVYEFTLSANIFTFQNLGTVPSGVYNVQFQPLSTPVTATFKFNNLTFFGTGGASFSNVTVNGTCQGYMF